MNAHDDLVSALARRFPVCPTCALPAHASESDDDNYHAACRPAAPAAPVATVATVRRARHKLCQNDKHVWSPIRNSTDERCTVCHTRFPCRPSCEHFDCCEARGEPLPTWYLESLKP